MSDKNQEIQQQDEGQMDPTVSAVVQALNNPNRFQPSYIKQNVALKESSIADRVAQKQQQARDSKKAEEDMEAAQWLRDRGHSEEKIKELMSAPDAHQKLQQMKNEKAMSEEFEEDDNAIYIDIYEENGKIVAIDNAIIFEDYDNVTKLNYIEKYLGPDYINEKVDQQLNEFLGLFSSKDKTTGQTKPGLFSKIGSGIKSAFTPKKKPSIDDLQPVTVTGTRRPAPEPKPTSSINFTSGSLPRNYNPFTGSSSSSSSGGDDELGEVKIGSKKTASAKAISYQELAKANKIKDPNKIKAGQTITLPDGSKYTIKKGDTLSGIAKNAGKLANQAAPRADVSGGGKGPDFLRGDVKISAGGVTQGSGGKDYTKIPKNYDPVSGTVRDRKDAGGIDWLGGGKINITPGGVTQDRDDEPYSPPQRTRPDSGYGGGADTPQQDTAAFPGDEDYEDSGAPSSGRPQASSGGVPIRFGIRGSQGVRKVGRSEFKSARQAGAIGTPDVIFNMRSADGTLRRVRAGDEGYNKLYAQYKQRAERVDEALLRAGAVLNEDGWYLNGELIETVEIIGEAAIQSPYYYDSTGRLRIISESEITTLSLADAILERTIKEALDEVGKEDEDIDNDGDSDKSDEYLAKRRKAISKAINEVAPLIPVAAAGIRFAAPRVAAAFGRSKIGQKIKNEVMSQVADYAGEKAADAITGGQK